MKEIVAIDLNSPRGLSNLSKTYGETEETVRIELKSDAAKIE